MSGGDGSPIRRAIVTVRGTDISTFLQAVTDDNGRFEFNALQAGRFTLTAEKPAYLRTYYGAASPFRPPAMPIVLGRGEQREDVTVPLTRGAVISGRVVSEAGAPLASAQVSVQVVSMLNGERRLTNPASGSGFATTDDRGAYRIYGLPAGEYLVRTTGGGGENPAGELRVVSLEELNAIRNTPAGSGAAAGPPVDSALTYRRSSSYYPGVNDPAEARTVTVAAGEDRDGIDIISGLVRTLRAEGIAVGPNGERLSNISVGLANVTTGSMYTSLGGVRADAEGRVVITSLSPGRWLLFGRGAEASVPSDRPFPWWTQTEIVVGAQNLSGFVLSFLPGSTVSGHLLFRGSQPRPDLAKIRLTLTPLPAISGAAASVPPVSPRDDGTFAFEHVPPGKYRLSAAPSGAWAALSATVDGRDTLDTPLEVLPNVNPALTVTFTDQPTELSGTVLDNLGRPAPEYSVVVFSADWSHGTVSPRRMSGLIKVASDGRYRVAGLPAGDYVLCVVTNIEPALLTDVTFLDQITSSGVRVTLAEGEKKSQDVRLGR